MIKIGNKIIIKIIYNTIKTIRQIEYGFLSQSIMKIKSAKAVGSCSNAAVVSRLQAPSNQKLKYYPSDNN